MDITQILREHTPGKTWELFTERQKAVYDIVLAANRKIVGTAKPGMTTKELNKVCQDVLSEGLIKLGLIKEPAEISKYYMHGRIASSRNRCA